MRLRLRPAVPSSPTRLLALVALVATLASVVLPSPLRASGIRAKTGAIEGRIAMRPDPPSMTADRYVNDAGEPREIPRIPVIVRIDGTVASAPPARPSGPLEMAQQGEAFSQLMLVVPVGAAVRFPNGDPVFHNVFSYSKPQRFDLGRYRRGESKTVTFNRAGYVKVLCEVHKWMRAAIVVVDNPYYAVVAEDGQYRIDGIPAGRYRVLIEYFDRRSLTADVDVPEGGSARLDGTL